MHYTKKIARSLAAAGLALILTAGTVYASVGGTATITADALRLRSQPTTDSSILTTLYKGTQVELLSGEENGWYKVSCGGKEGYMSAQWLQVNQEASVSAPAAPSAEAIPVVTADLLNVRSGPGTTYERVGTLAKGTQVTVVEQLDGWYQITSGELTGYVSADWIALDGVVPQEPETKLADVAGLVTAGPLNVRSGPGTGYDRVGSLKLGTQVTIHASVDGWYKITAGKVTGYVSADYVTELEDAEASAVGLAAAAMAKSLVGKPYVYGAEGPNAFDCSGLAYYIYGQLGYKIARGSSSQYKNSGKFVSVNDIQPGDLVYIFDAKFDGSGGTLPTTHMGIYVGDGQFIHASTTSYKVEYASLFNSYYTKYIVGYKRIA